MVLGSILWNLFHLFKTRHWNYWDCYYRNIMVIKINL